MYKQPPPAPTTSAAGPCITIIQICRTPRHWQFTQHHRTARPLPAMIKVLTSLIAYGTKRRHKRGVHSNNTSSDFALEISFRISVYNQNLSGVKTFNLLLDTFSNSSFFCLPFHFVSIYFKIPCTTIHR